MSFDIPTIDELKRAAESGQRITGEDVSIISQAESELTGSGPIAGGAAGMCLQFSTSINQWFPAKSTSSHRPEPRHEADELRHQDRRDHQEAAEPYHAGGREGASSNRGQSVR